MQIFLLPPSCTFLVILINIVAPEDYISDSGLLTFAIGDDRECHSVEIANNELCEEPVLEHFFSNLTLESGIPRITVHPDGAKVIIDDTDDCGKYSLSQYCFYIQLKKF